MLQIGAALFYYKLGQTLLQIGAGSVLQIGANVVTNWGSYYKLGQPLLQNRADITNWGKMYYKLGQVLQNLRIFQNLCMKLKFRIRYAMKIKIFVAREIQYFEIGIFSFNSCVYYLNPWFYCSNSCF